MCRKLYTCKMPECHITFVYIPEEKKTGLRTYQMSTWHLMCSYGVYTEFIRSLYGAH